jgi:hypothetical protein
LKHYKNAQCLAKRTDVQRKPVKYREKCIKVILMSFID